MDELQGPKERPTVVSREYVLRLVSSVFCGRCPEDLLSPWLDYLEKKGVVVRNHESYGLPGDPDALAAFPADAQRSLNGAFHLHVRSDACPKLLRKVEFVPAGGGSGAVSQIGPFGSTSGTYSPSPRKDDKREIERMRWDRERHVKELADFGPHAARVFDWIIQCVEAAYTGSPAGTPAPQQRAQADGGGDARTTSRSVTPKESVPATETDPFASFRKLALDLLDEARANLQFHMGFGMEWNDIRNSQMPEHLRRIREEASKARGDLSELKHELKEAQENNRWFNLRADRIRHAKTESPERVEAVCAEIIQEMQTALQAAGERADRAKAAAKAIESEWLAEEKKLADAWRREHHQKLLDLNDRFRAEFERHQHKLGGLVDLTKHEIGDLAKGSASACQVLLTFAERVAGFRQSTFKGLEPKDLRAAIEKEIGWLAREASPSVASDVPPPVPTPPPASVPENPVAANADPIPFEAVERAIVLLMRDRNDPESQRHYAREVGVHHTTLTRNAKWKVAWKACQQGLAKHRDELPEGRMDDEGNLDAAVEDVCENCRQKGIDRTVVVHGESVRLCDECATEQERTNSRTNQNP